jgi:hypothetical protein
MFEVSPLLIPIFALLIPIVAIWTKHQQRMAELRGPGTSSDDGATTAQADRVKALEERVRVLERIITDGSQGTALSARIEALRDDMSTPLTFEKERV